ncbi:MAG: hypothetical protein JWN84_1992 [Nocardioides sp.]|nr:hypothetical protein [Nocardioides sp.]
MTDYYTRHGATVPTAGLDRLRAACAALGSVGPSAATVRAYREAHRLVWDMRSLGELYPEIVEHLLARYGFERAGERIVVDFMSGQPAESYETDDIRCVVDVLLSREYRAALWDERVEPAFQRLAG